MYTWLVKKTCTPVAWVIILVVVLALLFGGYHTVKRFFTAGLKTEVKLGKEKGRAAVESGSDAVDTAGNRAAADQDLLAQAEEAKNDIRNQTDASGVTGAGRRGLCDRTPDRVGCGGVQRAPAR